ncbi:uncharacterized protein LOC131286540 [Anopheles ziemanni]|uniref:uncharacterized protein LOC131258579 n=1 Tax=Anopheles coustani TaxID=139045 RepID=UPI00265B007E|nr:uncharacterized protein LOC131258579 [Anopheles coustani]XP_058171485.1 uncharacterized protein LOC131286540 [Anopheles ziemanni]
MYGGGVNRPSSSVRHTKVKLGSASTASSGGSVDDYVLPPNVNGRSRGTLTVGFGDFSSDDTNAPTTVDTGLRWNSTKVYVSVDLQLVWWGQQSTAAATPIASLHWEQSSGKRKQTETDQIRYEVRTSAELFRRYLKSCEPIRVRLISKRTQSLIGTAKVQIPGQIINFRDTVEQTTAQACGEVLSVRGFRLGELSLEFTLSLNAKDRVATGVPSSSKPLQPNDGKENNKMLRVEQRPLSGVGSFGSFPVQPNVLSVEGKPAPLHETSQRPLTGGTNSRKKFNTLDGESKKKILDYLIGKPLDNDGRSELSALSDIRSISPAESMLEALARYDVAPKPQKQTYLQVVDCVRVLVENLRLTRAGQKEIQHRSGRELALPAFAVKMKLSRNATTTKLKFISNSISSDGADVSFEAHPQTARLSLVGMNDADDGEVGLHFEFGIHLMVGSFHKTRSFFLGSAMVSVRELLDGHFACHKRCPVRLASDDILLGSLTVRMELGSRGLHFGPELIDAVLVDKGNVTLESSSDSDSSSATVTPHINFSTYRNPGCTTQRPLCSGSHSEPIGCHYPGTFLHGLRQCMSHTGCHGDNRSPSAATKGDAKEGEGKSSSNQQTSSSATSGGTSGTNGAGQESTNGGDKPKAMETDQTPPDAPEHPKLLHGLLHLGQLRSNHMEIRPGEHFLVCHSFWTDDPSTLTSELCPEGGDFNYLRSFAVLPTRSFIERVRNQHMQVELWQKPTEGGEKLIGVTRLPLHQFYIAFRDAQLSEHLSHAKLPVISIDGWSGVGSPLASEPCGQLHAVLAIGTESQIEHFKLSRNLRHTSGDAPRSRAGNVPSMPSSPTRRIYPRPEHKSIQTMSNSNGGGGGGGGVCGGVGGCAKPTPTLEVANMLSAFIENLAQRLPISSERSTAPASYDNNNTIVGHSANNHGGSSDGPMDPSSGFLQGSPHSQANRPQLRKTADLLDNLQKALAQRPSASAFDGMGFGGCAASLLGVASTPADQTPPAAAGAGGGQSHDAPTQEGAPLASASQTQSTAPPPVTIAPVKLSESTSSGKESSPVATEPPDECKVFRVAIEIEQAVNLPKLTISKKYAKRHKNRNVPDTLELEPSAYATFEGYNLKPGLPNTVKSHEGIVYTTHVLERNCAPAWQKRFEVVLPVDLMLNDEKRFILKVWRKAALSDAPKCRLLPAPMEDAVIGFCAIDLSVLLSGMPYILGWYAIMDFSGRCNGQIKVNIHPLEDVQVYKTLDEQLNFQIPLSIDVECGGSGGLADASNTSLSRALKRKFTELEEITERLKARLFDVTGDECLDLDDQFERDLNTEADEAEDDAEWPDPHGDMSNQKRNSQYPNGALTLTTNTSSYSMCASAERRSTQERSLTGCSNRAQTTNSGSGSRSQMSSQLQLAELLQTHDIDTLINPALLKNLLNASTSDSTPPLGEDGGEVVDDHATDADMSEESSLSCKSSLPVDSANGKPREVGATVASGDRVKQIASALQRTTLSESNTGTGRQAPEGEPMADSNK